MQSKRRWLRKREATALVLLKRKIKKERQR